MPPRSAIHHDLSILKLILTKPTLYLPHPLSFPGIPLHSPLSRPFLLPILAVPSVQSITIMSDFVQEAGHVELVAFVVQADRNTFDTRSNEREFVVLACRALRLHL